MHSLQMENRTRLKTCNGQGMYGAIWCSVFCGTFDITNIELNAGVVQHGELSMIKPL